MTGRTDFDDILAGWLANDAPAREPDELLSRVLVRVAATRRRPAWWARPRVGVRSFESGMLLAPQIAVVGASVIAGLVLLGIALVVGSRPQLPRPLASPGLLLAARDGAVLLVDPAGTVRRTVPTGSLWGGAAWSPDGRRFAHWDGTDGQPVLVVADAAMVEQLRIPVRVTSGDVPTWSPDGRQIAWTGDAGDGGQIFVVDATPGARSRSITEPALQAISPGWSPDGSVIAFRGGVGPAGRALYVVRPDGTGILRLTDAARDIETCSPPAWAPDGRSILFHTYQGDIWSVRPDGMDEHIVVGTGRFEFCPSWSPDGRRIAYVVWLDTGKYVVVADADGSGEIVPNGPLYNALAPIWSPDGRSIVVNERVLDGGPNPIGVLDPDAKRAARTFFIGDALIVDWQRIQP